MISTRIATALVVLLLGCGPSQSGPKPGGGSASGDDDGEPAAGAPPGRRDRDAGPVEPLKEDVEVPPAP